ncbi:hypothetical protein H4R24_002945 [Coemansia sp. RSA 988]|nr:hypothetical protein H4R24_002945 [Coemansia sp. RSA 988]
MDALMNSVSNEAANGDNEMQNISIQDFSDSESAILDEIHETDMSRRSSFASSVDFDEWMQKHASLDDGESAERDSDTHVEDVVSSDEEDSHTSYVEESPTDIRRAWIEAQRQWNNTLQQEGDSISCEDTAEMVSLDEAIDVGSCEDKCKSVEGHESSTICDGNDEAQANGVALADYIAAVSAQESGDISCTEEQEKYSGDELQQVGSERPPLPQINTISDICKAVHGSLDLSFEAVDGIIGDRTEWCTQLDEYDVELEQLSGELAQSIAANDVLETRIKELEAQLDSERQKHKTTEDALEIVRNSSATDQHMNDLKTKNAELVRKLEVFARQCTQSQTREQMLHNTNRELREQLAQAQKMLQSSPTSVDVAMTQLHSADAQVVEARREASAALERLSAAQLELACERQQTATLKRQLSADSLGSMQPEKVAKRGRVYDSAQSSAPSPTLPNPIGLHDHVLSAAEHARERRRNSGPRRPSVEYCHIHSEFGSATPTTFPVNHANTPPARIASPPHSPLARSSRRPGTPRILVN